MKNIVVIGGGTGLSSMMMGMKSSKRQLDCDRDCRR